MRTDQAEVAAFAAVAPRALHAYLTAQGWRKEERLGEKGDLYILAGAPGIAAPASDQLADYALDISQILDILAQVEGRSRSSILRDLHVADVDLIRVRTHQASDDGSISVDRGVELVQQSRDLILAAACAASRPQRAFRAGGNREAVDYLQAVRFGQTERGSFVVTILSPVPPSLTMAAQPVLWEELETEPFARRVTRRLVGALEAAHEAVGLANRGEGIDAFEERVSRGVSANLCAAVARMAERGAGLDISVSWALTRLTPQRRHKVEFSPADAYVLDEAARVLREREPRPGERLEGYVTHLARGPEATEGQATIRALVDAKVSSVRVDFGPDLYHQVVHAHADRRGIALEGDLERDGQRWRLKHPRNLFIAPADDS